MCSPKITSNSDPDLGSAESLGIPQGRLSLPFPHFSARRRPHLSLICCFPQILFKYHFLPPLTYFPFPHPVNTQGHSRNSGLGEGFIWEAGTGQGLWTPSLWLSSNLYSLPGAASKWFCHVTNWWLCFSSFRPRHWGRERVWCFPSSLGQHEPHSQQLLHLRFSPSVTDGGACGLSDPWAVQSTSSMSGTGNIMKHDGSVTLFTSLNGVNKYC